MLRDSCYIWFVYNNINNWLIACTMQRNIVSSYYCRSFCPNLDFYIFFHYTCIRFTELIWNLYCSLIIKKNYQIWVLITMNKQKQKLILNDSCFFLYRVFTFWKFFDQILLILFSIRNWGCRKRGMYCLCNILRILVTWAYRETSINVLVTLVWTYFIV